MESSYKCMSRLSKGSMFLGPQIIHPDDPAGEARMTLLGKCPLISDTGSLKRTQVRAKRLELPPLPQSACHLSLVSARSRATSLKLGDQLGLRHKIHIYSLIYIYIYI